MALLYLCAAWLTRPVARVLDAADQSLSAGGSPEFMPGSIDSFLGVIGKACHETMSLCACNG